MSLFHTINAVKFIWYFTWFKRKKKKKKTLCIQSFPDEHICWNWLTETLCMKRTFRFSHIGEIQKEKARKPRLLLSLWMLHFLRTVRAVPVIFLITWFGTNGNCFLTMLNNEIRRNRPISLPKKWLLHLYSIQKSSIISATLENETVSVSRVGSAWTGAVKQWERFRSVNCSVLQSNVSIRWSNHLSSTIFLQDLHCRTRKPLPAFSLRIKRH